MTAPMLAERHRWRVVVAWLTAAALLVGAWQVVAATPTFDDEVAPFPVSAPMGDWGTGRNITVRVVDARFTDSIGDQLTSLDGNWLVVDIEAATVVSDSLLWLATLTVEGVTYNATDRIGSTIFLEALVPGLPRAGSLVFELPADLAVGSAELTLGLDRDPSLDSLIVVPIELGELSRTGSVELTRPDWATP